MTSRYRLFVPALCAALAQLSVVGCTNIPELDATVPDHLEDADYPSLAPIETLLVPMRDPLEQTGDLQSELQARRDSLQRRAKRLNAPVVDEPTQARMKAGIVR